MGIGRDERVSVCDRRLLVGSFGFDLGYIVFEVTGCVSEVLFLS